MSTSDLGARRDGRTHESARERDAVDGRSTAAPMRAPAVADAEEPLIAAVPPANDEFANAEVVGSPAVHCHDEHTRSNHGSGRPDVRRQYRPSGSLTRRRSRRRSRPTRSRATTTRPFPLTRARRGRSPSSRATTTQAPGSSRRSSSRSSPGRRTTSWRPGRAVAAASPSTWTAPLSRRSACGRRRLRRRSLPRTPSTSPGRRLRDETHAGRFSCSTRASPGGG